MELKKVVVTGLGALSPLGNNVKDFWSSLTEGKSGAAPITKFDATKFKTQFACEVKGFNPEDVLERREIRRLDPFAHYAIAASDEGIEDAGLDFDQLDRDRIGVIWASGIGGLQTFQDELVNFGKGDGTPRFSPFFIPKMILDIAAGHISIRHGLRGINYATVSACASSTHALIDSLQHIQMGRADIIVTGGSEAAVNEAGIGGFNSMKALSQRNDSPETASRPFDLDRDGFVLGEGGACLILEEYEHAKKRGAKIYAELVGGGMSADAHHITAPHPEGLGARNVMMKALADAQLNPEEIDYVNVHGTSTPLGDISEIAAIMSVFGEHAYELNVSSTKSMTGHLLGAAGAIEALAAIGAIKYGVVPPTINHFTDDPAFDARINLTFNEAQERKVKAVISNTFGFGGHNASVIFKQI